ncbi:MAG: gas vesicle protein [Desulfomonilaceae bacterium]
MHDDLVNDDLHEVTLCEALDRILNKGAVIIGEVTISVANVDLIYLGLQLVLSSIETRNSANREMFGNPSLSDVPKTLEMDFGNNSQFPL